MPGQKDVPLRRDAAVISIALAAELFLSVGRSVSSATVGLGPPCTARFAVYTICAPAVLWWGGALEQSTLHDMQGCMKMSQRTKNKENNCANSNALRLFLCSVATLTRPSFLL